MTNDQLRSFLQTNINNDTVQLQDKQLDDSGAKLIAAFMKSNKVTTNLYLYLWNNKIGDEGAKGIGEGLKGNSSLTYLSLILTR
jgi:hypothetical protein